MKTILCLFTLFAYFSGYSQDYYSGDTAYGSGVTYKVTSWGNNLGRIISNINNTKVRTQPLLKNGSEVNPGYIKVAKSNDIDGTILKKIITGIIPASKIAEWKKEKTTLLLLEVVIDPNGKISEVCFLIPNNSILLAIHPDNYYQIEQKIKDQIKYTLDAQTRNWYQWITEGMGIRSDEL